MMTFFRYLTTHKIPQKDTLRSILRRPLSWYGVILYVLIIAMALLVYIGIISINKSFLVTVPARGGTIVEGIIGAPRLLNPVTATTETDVALTKLIYSGLMRETQPDMFEPDLAESVTTSTDGRTYTFVLRDGLKWSDGEPLSAQDVVFTYTKRALFQPNSYWQNVTLSAPDAHTIVATLPAPNSRFLKEVTLGVIPMHIWSEVVNDEFENAALNLKPVGSGPFSFVRLVERNGISQEITLKRNRHYVHARPYVDKYRIVFFANQNELAQALLDNDITFTAAATSATAQLFENTYSIQSVDQSSSIALFQLKSSPLFSLQTLSVLNASIDKARILDTIEYGYGILPPTTRLSDLESRAALSSLGFTTAADGTLEKNGTPIEFSIAVENNPKILATAYAFAQSLQDIGITVTFKAFDSGTFQDVIERNTYQFFFGILKNETIATSYEPIITLYTQAYTFIHDPAVSIAIPTPVSTPADRYRQSTQWYTRTNDVWKLFTK